MDPGVDYLNFDFQRSPPVIRIELFPAKQHQGVDPGVCPGSVTDPGVHYRSQLPSTILTVQALFSTIKQHPENQYLPTFSVPLSFYMFSYNLHRNDLNDLSGNKAKGFLLGFIRGQTFQFRSILCVVSHVSN